MFSPSGRYVASLNGEIYNHRELRDRLTGEGAQFRGHSDTEVLLGAVDNWGLVPALQATNGMFALAMWDRKRAVFSQARDRLGEKPLYYGWMGTNFLFGSELKALHRHPSFQADIDPQALALYLRHSCVPAPWSSYQGIRKLPPATVLTVNPSGSRVSQMARYWSMAKSRRRAWRNRCSTPHGRSWNNSTLNSVSRSAFGWLPTYLLGHFCREEPTLPQWWR
jgi:asparagine synthase (glutamine-hydrolysing)